MSTIASRIMDVMKNKNITYIELSKATGISKSALQRYATGETAKIPLDRLESIANALKITPAYLMGWEEEGTTDLVQAAVDIAKWINAPAEEVVAVVESMDLPNGIDSEAIAKISAIVQAKMMLKKEPAPSGDELSETFRNLFSLLTPDQKKLIVAAMKGMQSKDQ